MPNSNLSAATAEEGIYASLTSGDAVGLQRATEFAELLQGPALDRAALSALYKIAETAERLENLGLACSMYGRILASPDLPLDLSVAANYHAGYCQYRMGNPAEATAHYRAAIKDAPGWPAAARRARWDLAELLFRDNALEAAEPHYRQLAGDADCEFACRTASSFRLADCLVRLENPEATEVAEQIHAELPDLDFSGCLPVLEMLFQTSASLEVARQFSLASRIYSSLLEKKDIPAPNRANAAYRLALCLEYRALWVESIDYYRTAIRLGTEAPELTHLATTQLALNLLAAEEYEEAAELYAVLCGTAEKFGGSRPLFQFRQALCLFRAGRGEEAETVLLELPRHAHTDELIAKADHLLAEIFEGRKDYREAARCYRRIIANPSAEIPEKLTALQRVNLLPAIAADGI